MSKEKLRQLPSVDRLLSEAGVRSLIATYGRPQAVEALRETLDAVRHEVRAGADVPDVEALAARTDVLLQERLAPTLRPVINATGVIVHTNLGRAPLSAAARAAMDAVARGYSTLEYDLEAGGRGHRSLHAEQLLCQLTGAEAALVVNNNALSLIHI